MLLVSNALQFLLNSHLIIYHFLLQNFSMIGFVHNYDLLRACIEDILSTIKPVEDDRKKRLCAIQELADSIYSVGPLRGIGYKHFSSFGCVSSGY